MHQDEINELIKIAKQLDDKGYCKLSEKIDNINVKIALLSDTGAKAVIEPHPGKKYVRRQLGFPPQNVFESLQLKIEDLINKLKDKKNPNKRYTIDKFIDTILQGYLKSGYVNASFVDFLVKSPSFTEQVYRKIQNNTEQQENWKKLFKDIVITIQRTLYAEIKKLDKQSLQESRKKSHVYEVINYLILLQDFLPIELISEIKAYKEFLDGRSELETHFENMADITEEDPEAQLKAEEELRNYKRIPEMEEIQNIKNSINHIKLTLIKIAKELDNSGQYKKADKFTKIAIDFTADDLIMPGEKKAILTPSQRNLYNLIDQFKVLVEMSNNLSTEDNDSYFNDLKSNLLSSLRDTGGKIASLLTELNLDSEEFDNYLLEL